MSDAVVKALQKKASLSSYEPTFREKASDVLRALLFSDDREGQRKAERLSNVLETVTPYGVATGIDDMREAVGQGDYATAGLLGAMAFVPGYHGSPVKNLKRISATPPARQFDNATSQFGAFLSPTEEGAKKYAGSAGRVYKTGIDLQNPYEMPWREFSKWQSVSRLASGKLIDPSKWGSRASALKAASPEFVEGLKAMGHDGILVYKPNGELFEIASFKDIPTEHK